MEGVGDWFAMTDSSVTVAGRSPSERWASVAAVPQQREDRLPQDVAVRKWSQIYSLFGASGESGQDEVYAAVTLYFLVNGCSPSGKYARDVRTGGGVSVPVGQIIKITGRLEGDIRQFLRAHMRKSYECLKYNGAVQQDLALQDKAERLGVPRGQAWLLADWLRDCEYLSGDETEIHDKLSKQLIADANRRRFQPVLSHRVDDKSDRELMQEPVRSVVSGQGFQGAEY